MSQNVATSRTSVRMPAARARQQPRLRVITGEHARRTHTAFGVCCAALLALGLLALLLLNTARAEQSFALEGLQQNTDSLKENREQLRSELSSVSASEQLALQAQKMGMQPSGSVTYVRAADHKVLGVAKRDTAGSAFTVNTLPDTPASGVASQAVAASTRGVAIKPAPKPTATAASGKATSSSGSSGSGRSAKPATAKSGAAAASAPGDAARTGSTNDRN